MTILVTNDDGIQAPGLHRLIEQVADLGDVYAVAPDGARSGMSSAITVDRPLFVHDHEDYLGASMHSVNGTPTDCVKLAMHHILPERPALVLSGINHGSNSGNSVIYSGTMGAAAEACMAGCIAVGFSLTHHSVKADFQPGLPYVRAIIEETLRGGLPEGVCLNVNIPAKCEPLGVKVVRAARGYWTDEYAPYVDPHGRPYYWLTGRFVNLEPDDEGTDEYWLSRRYITITPYAPQLADRDAVAALAPRFAR